MDIKRFWWVGALALIAILGVIYLIGRQASSRDGSKVESTQGDRQSAGSVGKDGRPVLESLGVNIDTWDKATNLAGDILFTKDIIFDDGHISDDRPFVDFGLAPKYQPDKKNIEYWFIMPLGTKLRAPVSGIVRTSYFDHVKDYGVSISDSENSEWQVSFEHMANLTVKDGDRVKAGDIVGESAPRNTSQGKYAMTELSVWQAGQSIIKHCPFDFLVDNQKEIYSQKLSQLAADWEAFLGKDIYQEDAWVSPGCLEASIVER